MRGLLLVLSILFTGDLIFALPAVEARKALRTASNLATNNVLHLQRNAVNLIEADDQQSYAAEVTIDGIKFILAVDTGSSLTWVTSANNTCAILNSNSTCTFPTHLSVWKDEQWLEPFRVDYGDKTSSSGGLIQRPVSIAGIAINRQTIGLFDETIALGPRVEDGLLGLAPLTSSTNSKRSYPSIFGSMDLEGLIPEKKFSIALLGTAHYGTPDTGLIAFGGIPTSIALKSSWGTATLLEDGLYKIMVDGFTIQGTESMALTAKQRSMVVDSGCFISYFPNPIAHAIFDLLPGTGAPDTECSGRLNEKCRLGSVWIIPCEGEVPHVSVTVGNVDFLIAKENLVIQMKEKEYCISGIMPELNGQGILGSTFMRDRVVVHDFTDPEEPRMEIASCTHS